jgi:metal transporter CNNM
VRSLPLHKVPFVAQDEPLLGILDKFQEGRSHMAIVTRTSVEKALSVKKAVKKSITQRCQRIKNRVGISDSPSDNSSNEEPAQTSCHKPRKTDNLGTIKHERG